MNAKQFNKVTISVIGLGKLGVPMSVCFIYKGYHVIGVDIDKRKVDIINKGNSPISESQVDELLRENKKRITATTDISKAILDTTYSFVVVPTPSMHDGSFSNKYVLDTCERIGSVLHKKEDFHLVVITSTVMPGSMEGCVKSTLEEFSGKKCGRDFGLCYSPEFIALGSTIKDFLNPDFYLIGESDVYSGNVLSTLYRTICENNAPIKRMNFINAELTKLAVNTFVTTKISYANMLRNICQEMPGGNIDVLTDALGNDKRIGNSYLTGATGYGGPCFPRDNAALMHFARKIGVSCDIAEATDAINERQMQQLVDLICSRMSDRERVAVVGLSYKPDTGVIDESQGVKLVNKLLSKDIPLVVYDPQAMEAAKVILKDRVEFAHSLAECARGSDIIVVTGHWEEFKNINKILQNREAKPKVIIDCWRILDSDTCNKVSEYIPLGVNVSYKRKVREKV